MDRSRSACHELPAVKVGVEIRHGRVHGRGRGYGRAEVVHENASSVVDQRRSHPRVVHLWRSTCHAISGRGA